MNQTIEQFARQQIREGLKLCTERQQKVFLLMYSPKKPNVTVDEVAESMPTEKLDWALTQIETTQAKRREP
jgi:hypothetical protein